MYTFLSNDPMYNRLSTKLNPDLSLKGITDTLNLDKWEAHKIPNYREDALEVGESFMIRRLSKNPELYKNYHDTVIKPYVTDKYEILQYTAGIQWLYPFLEEQLLSVHSVFYVDNGSKLAITCDIGVEAEVVKGDTVRRFLLLSLSHDGSSRMLGFNDICPVCCNTLEQAQIQSKKQLEKHFTLDDKNPGKSLEEARKAIDLVKQRFVEVSLPKYKAYNELVLEPNQVDYIFRTVINAPLEVPFHQLPEKLGEKLLTLRTAYEFSPGQELRAKNSGYRVVSAVSNYAQFTNGSSNYKSHMADQFGSGKKLRKQTFELLDALLPSSAIPVGAGK